MLAKPQSPTDTVRLLVIHAGGVGDFLLACPALRMLAKHMRMELAGRRERLELAVAGGISDAAHDLDAIGFESAFSTPNARLRNFLSRFTSALVWMRDTDGGLRANLKDCGVPHVRCFPGLPDADWNAHASNYYLSCAETMLSGVQQIGPTEAPLSSPAEPILPIAAGPERWDVVVHPGSGSPTKNWPMERFAKLAEQIEYAGRRVTWLRGPAEEALAYPGGVELVEGRALTDLARLLAGTRLYVGNDSGVTHLATAVGCPTVAIFGPTDPAVWGPLGTQVRIVRGDPWPEIGAVSEAVHNLASNAATPSQV